MQDDVTMTTRKAKSSIMPDLFDELTAATKDLTFTSESDAPVKALRAQLPEQAAEGIDLLTPELVLAATNHPAGTPVTTQTVDAFFAPATTDQDWYGDEEKATSARFRELIKLLKENLRGLQVFKVGAESELDVYVVGLSKQGGDKPNAGKAGALQKDADKSGAKKNSKAPTATEIVGVQTQVVET